MALEFNKQWITVSERKPENSDLIYVFNVKSGGWKGYLAIYNVSKDYFCMHGGGVDGFPIEVTHWYPLPHPSYCKDGVCT